MPAGLDFGLYFNIVFFGIIGIGFLVGYIRGMRKTLYALLATAIFYAIFFLTIDMVITQLWGLNIAVVLDQVSQILPDIAGATTAEDAVIRLLNVNLGDTLGESLSNEVFLDFVSGLAQLILKIIYTILYFTVGKVIYMLVTLIIRALFFGGKNKKKMLKIAEKKALDDIVEVTGKNGKVDKRARRKAVKLAKKKALKAEQKRIRAEKKRLLGAIFGGAKGTINAFVTLIVIGGFLSFADSALSVIPDTGTGSLLDLGAETEEIITDTRTQINTFNGNLYVKTASNIKINNPSYEGKIPLHLYLFDSVLSFEFKDEKIAIRQEVAVLSSAAGAVLNSEYLESEDLSDITAQEVELVFTNLADSNMVTSLIPLAIEVGSEMFETPVEIPIEELYEIDWEAELKSIGAVASIGFELLNNAGVLTNEAELETIVLDGTEVKELFDTLAETEIATLGAFVAMNAFIDSDDSQISAIITVPTDLDWAAEFKAFGSVAETILNSGLTVGDVTESDPAVLIGTLAEVDLTILLDSQIVSHALKNLFSGEAGIEGMDIIVVPDGIVWFDVYEADGETIETPGELRNILVAVNAIVDVAGGIDFNDIDFTLISDFDDNAIDAIFDSELLVASISSYLLEMDLGETPLVIPDSVLDENRYLLSSELKTIARSAKILVDDLACDEGDVDCEATGFDVSKAFSLSDLAIDTLTSSDILGATVGQLIIDQGGTSVTIPNRALETISVDSVDRDVVSKAEIKKVFQAISVLGFTDLETMEFDASIIQTLGTVADPLILDTVKSDKLFGSDILMATLSNMLFEQTEGLSSTLSVPYFGDDGRVIRSYDASDDIEYLSTDELEDILQAFLTLNITDFANVESMDLNTILTNAGSLMDSAILHATISKQVFDLGGSIITVPYFDEDGNDVRISVGDALASTDTVYIKKTEITGVLDALDILVITDINSFTGDVDLEPFFVEANRNILLSSSIMHATISKQLIDLGTGVLVIPDQDVDTNDVKVTVGLALEGTETAYIRKTEITAMFEALEVLDITDVDAITTFTGAVVLSRIFGDANQDIILSSASMHATISKQMMDLGAGNLVIPDADILGNPIKVTVATTDYLVKAEIKAIINSLEELGLTDIANMNFDANTILNKDFSLILTSASLLATISDKILPSALDETTPYGATSLIVPTSKRENILVNTVPQEQIEQPELLDLLNGLNVLGITDFTSGVDPSIVTGLSDTDLDILFASASVHTTVDNMLRGNGSVSTQIPAIAVEDQAYKTNIIMRSELKAFVRATQTITTGGSFTTVSFDAAAIAALSPADQAIVVESMIVRNIITPTLVTLAGSWPGGYPDPIDDFDYENDDNTSILEVAKILEIFSIIFP